MKFYKPEPPECSTCGEEINESVKFNDSNGEVHHISCVYNSNLADELEFIDAVENDIYEELDLGGGFTLITDWEGDESFHPYVVPPQENHTVDKDTVEILLENVDFLTVTRVEWDSHNGVYHVSASMKK